MASAQELISQFLITSDPFEKAKTIQTLRSLGLTFRELSLELKMKPSYLCHFLRLIKLPTSIIDGYYSKYISLSHLFIISRLKTQEQMWSMYEKIMRNSLTVLHTEIAVREMLYGLRSEGVYIDKTEVGEWVRKVKESFLNAHIKVVQSRRRSAISIIFDGNLQTTSTQIKKIMLRIQQLGKRQFSQEIVDKSTH